MRPSILIAVVLLLLVGIGLAASGVAGAGAGRALAQRPCGPFTSDVACVPTPAHPGDDGNEGDEEPAPPENDRDADGTLNDADWCPDEGGPASANGCPDADGDAVPDHLDLCFDVAGAPGNGGCPVELDPGATPPAPPPSASGGAEGQPGLLLPAQPPALADLTQVEDCAGATLAGTAVNRRTLPTTDSRIAGSLLPTQIVPLLASLDVGGETWYLTDDGTFVAGRVLRTNDCALLPAVQFGASDAAALGIVPLHVRGWTSLGGMSDDNIMAVLLIIMMEAANDSQEDLKAMLDRLKELNQQKEAWRHVQAAGDGAQLADVELAIKTIMAQIDRIRREEDEAKEAAESGISNMPMSEASLEFLIGQAGALTRADMDNMLATMMEYLKQLQKEAREDRQLGRAALRLDVTLFEPLPTEEPDAQGSGLRLAGHVRIAAGVACGDSVPCVAPEGEEQSCGEIIPCIAPGPASILAACDAAILFDAAADAASPCHAVTHIPVCLGLLVDVDAGAAYPPNPCGEDGTFEVSDLDGDGRLSIGDLLPAAPGGLDLWLADLNGDGAAELVSLVMADLDGDGAPDLVAWSWGTTGDVTEMDADGDGRLTLADILLPGDGSVVPGDGSVVPGDGSVVPGDGSVVPAAMYGVGDFDGNGALEVVSLLPAVQ